MPSCWISERTTSRGDARFRVHYRTGGRESKQRYGGTYRHKSRAETRRSMVMSLLAAGIAPAASGRVAHGDNPLYPLLWLCDRLISAQVKAFGSSLPHLDLARQEIKRLFDAADDDLDRDPLIFDGEIA